MRILAALIMLAAVLAVLALLSRTDPHPLLIDAAADERWCDFPKQREPLMKPPGLYLPNGELKNGNDKGTA